MKRKKNIIIIFILLLIILLGLLIGLKILNNARKKRYVDERIYLANDEFIYMVSYIPHSLVSFESEVDAYFGNLVTVKDAISTILSPVFLRSYVNTYKMADLTDEIARKEFNDWYITDSIYLKSDIEKVLYKNYNVEFNFLDNIIDDKVKIISGGDNYITFVPTVVSNFLSINKLFISIDSSYATKNKAMIVEKAIFYMLEDDKYYIYKNSNVADKKNLIKTYDAKNKDGTSRNIEDIIKEDFQDYNYGFKHTYKQNDMGWYWHSTEFIRIN